MKTYKAYLIEYNKQNILIKLAYLNNYKKNSVLILYRNDKISKMF